VSIPQPSQSPKSSVPKRSVPALPESEEDSSKYDIAADDRQDHCEWDADLVEVFVVVTIVTIFFRVGHLQFVVLDEDNRIIT